MGGLGAVAEADDRLREDWALVEALLPVGWEDKARELRGKVGWIKARSAGSTTPVATSSAL